MRAEIEALRSGTDSESMQKIQSLESTIESLEGSQEQLSRALENEKRRARDAVLGMEQKIENLLREQETKVLFIYFDQEHAIHQ